MKEFEILLRVRVEAEDMNDAELAAGTFVLDLREEDPLRVDWSVLDAVWDKISPIRKCRPKVRS